MTFQLKDPAISEAQIREKVVELARKLSLDYLNQEPVFAAVLKGAWVFHADLVRALDIPVDVDFIKVSSYGSKTKSSGTIRFDLDFSVDLRGRHLVLVEDIIDTGRTLAALLSHLKDRAPASIRTCVLLDKPSRRETEIVPDYVGFTVPDEFVVGYGLDWDEKYRHLPYIARIAEEAGDESQDDLGKGH